MYTKFIASAWPKRLGAALVVAWMVALSVAAVRARHPAQARGFSSGGGGMIFNNGGGLSKVTTNSPGLLAGSGTTGNPLTATLSVSGIITGTGSSGSPLTATETGDISAVTAGSGLTGGGTTGAVTLAVGAGSGILAAGTVTAVDVGTGITISSNHVTLNQTAATCSNGQAITATTATGGETCGNVLSNVYEGTHYEWIDEFMWSNSGFATDGAPVGPFWTCSRSGTSGTCTGVPGTGYSQTRPGVLEMGLGTTASTSVSALSWGSTGVSFDIGNWTFEWTGGWEVLSSSGTGYAATLGFADSSTIDNADGCYFLYDERNAAAAPTTGAGNTSNLQKLACVCAANSVRTEYVMDGTVVSDSSFTTVNAPVAALSAPSTNINTLKIVMTGHTEADFYVNGVLSCKITSHIPTGSTRPTGLYLKMNRTAGTTPVSTMDTDRVRITLDMTSARSP